MSHTIDNTICFSLYSITNKLKGYKEAFPLKNKPNQKIPNMLNHMHLLSTFGVSNGQEIRYIVNSLTEYRLDSVTLPQSAGIYPENVVAIT